MFCRKCGKEVPDDIAFCDHCGFDLSKSTSPNHIHTAEEQVPLLLLINQIMKHKVIVIASLVVVALVIGGYSIYKNHQEKEKAKAALLEEISHVMEIVGTYANDDITLVLSADNTATISYKEDGWREKTGKGYWREKYEGSMIEIEFSKHSESVKEILPPKEV